MFVTKGVLKYYKKLNLWKNSTGTNTFDPSTIEARSYRHWKYVKVINGKVVFNNYRYSVTTTQHQYAMNDLLKELKIKVHYTVNTRHTLDNLSDILEDDYKTVYRYEWKLANTRLNNSTKEKYSNTIQTAKDDIKELIKVLKLEDMTEDRKKEIKEYTINNAIRDKESNARNNKEKREANKILSEVKKKLMLEALPKHYY